MKSEGLVFIVVAKCFGTLLLNVETPKKTKKTTKRSAGSIMWKHNARRLFPLLVKEGNIYQKYPCLASLVIRHFRKVFHLPILRRNIPINCRLNSKGWGIGTTGKQGPALIHT